MVKKADLPTHVVATAMALAARRGWRNLSLGEIAQDAGLTLAQLYEIYPAKGAILTALGRQADAAMLAAASAKDHAGESPRERLFDVLMARFDALNPYKDGLAAVARDALADPLGGAGAALCRGPGLLRSMRWALEAAGIGSSGPRGALRARGLLVIYATTLPVWLRDDSPDMGSTMAALDRRLARAERLAGLCDWGRAPDQAPDQGQAPDAEAEAAAPAS